MVVSIEMEHWRDMCPCIVFPINFCNKNISNDIAVTVYLW